MSTRYATPVKRDGLSSTYVSRLALSAAELDTENALPPPPPFTSKGAPGMCDQHARGCGQAKGLSNERLPYTIHRPRTPAPISKTSQLFGRSTIAPPPAPPPRPKLRSRPGQKEEQ